MYNFEFYSNKMNKKIYVLYKLNVLHESKCCKPFKRKWIL
jgi:hypothetical protein